MQTLAIVSVKKKKLIVLCMRSDDTYFFFCQGTDHISSQEKLDFWLRLPCSSFMIGRLAHRESVTDLLAGGTLTSRSNMTLENISTEFSQV